MEECQREIRRLRGVVANLESQLEEYNEELKKVLSKYFTDELVAIIMKDLEEESEL